MSTNDPQPPEQTDVEIQEQQPTPSKRIFDVILSCVLLLVLFPFLLLVALYIKAVSKGPVLYIQPRLGMGGKMFRILKFRTMHHRKQVRDEAHRQYVSELATGDQVLKKPDYKSQLIPGGALLRSLSIDELPQLWNVVVGQMSLVGPRPDLLKLEDYTPEQLRRFEVLPGITGLWQVNDKNEMTFNEMIKLDIEYVDTGNLLLDIKILFATAVTLIRPSNS